jgi:flagellar biosynthesis/type III secretory pathway protein FliH
MKNQRVLEHSQVNWFSDDNMRLNYQMIFNERVLEESQPEVDQDFSKVLAERDSRWKNKLKVAKEDAFKKGFAQGFEEGHQEATSTLEQRIAGIQEALTQAQQAWEKQQQMLQPGILDMAFDIAESILGIPVENPEIRTKLEERLGLLLQKVDETSKPMLWINQVDFEFVSKLKEEYAPNTPVNIQISEEINPGEFKLETRNETVIQNFKVMMSDFRQTLTLPSWK